jgi:phosphatidylinositol 4-kinase
MPFLLPAVVAASCDFFILYISQYVAVEVTGDDAISPLCQLTYFSSYIVPAASIRLFLLFFPLPYYSYNGTALKCAGFYKLFYGCTLMTLLSHIFTLSMCDPLSLGSLIPTKSKLPLHEAVTRHIWLVLFFSLAANLCHILLFLHVRSTAPINADLLQGRPKVLLYYAKEREDTERDSLLRPRMNSEDSSSNRMQQISNIFVSEVQTRLQKAKGEWAKRILDYQNRSEGTGTQDFLHRPVVPFRVMLQLFAYEDVLTNGRLDSVYEIDDGATLLFFVPQLLSFLLHGAYESSSRLEEWVLDTCRKNIHFAHRCYWFLRAWSLESNASGPTRLSHSSSLASFENLDDTAILDGSGKDQCKFLPEERAVIEDLLLKVMTFGEQPARNLHLGVEDETSQQQQYEIDISPSALMSQVESGAIPVDPNTGMPSARHWESVAATRKIGFMPLENSLIAPKNTSTGIDTSYFDATPVFLDALLTIADNLFRVPREHRMPEFKRQLQLLEVEALPSNSIYVPLQNSNQRVWRIVADESIAINTKERVPCIVCLEVVEYSEVNNTSPTEHAHHISLPDLTGVLNEKELINRWRYDYRDPHRRDTAFKKLAYQMKHSMRKIHLDQMKSSMKAQIEKLKDTKTNLQDIFTIHVPDTFTDEDMNENGGPSHLYTMNPMLTDIERGNDGESTYPNSITERPVSSFSSEEPVTPDTVRKSLIAPLTPPDSGSSTGPQQKTPMGQWSSPSRKPRLLDVERTANPNDAFQSFDVEQLSYQQGISHVLKGEKVADIEADDDGYNQHASPKSGKTGPKTPPVVFRENWKDKEERIRATSAFGSHPGWKLLPILVKSNDDLRQEQLASQIIYKISAILSREQVPVWLCPYEILALTETGGLIEAIPDTISIASLKKNDSNFSSLKGFFDSHFDDPDQLADAKANFCESLAAYSIVCFLMQIKDRHNGNILIDNKGHLIHIDFGFFFLSSPGKNTGFESAPFKLTRELVDVLDGPDSRFFRIFRMLCYRSFIALRRHCMEIILLVEMLKKGNENLPCFRGRPDDAIRELRERFRLDLNDRACLEYVNYLIDESLENWRTNWYDRYQRYCVGVL